MPAPAARTGSLLKSKIVQASASCSTPREALIVSAILRHPWLLDEFLEEIAAFHFLDADCARLRDAALRVHHSEDSLDNEKLLAHLSAAGYAAELERAERATAHNADAHFARTASKEQVLEGWRHVMMLHGKAGVPQPLQEAESDYLSDPTTENFAKLQAMVRLREITAS